MVPTFTRTDRRGRRPAKPRQPRHEYAADLPRGLLTGLSIPASESPIPTSGRMCAADRPRSARFESARRLRSFTHWFLSYAFSSRSPNPPRLAVPTRPGFVRTASALTGVPRIRLSPASVGCCDSPAARSFTPLGFIALRGARTGRRTCGPDRRRPTGTAWFGSSVPVAPPNRERLPDRRYSPTQPPDLP